MSDRLILTLALVLTLHTSLLRASEGPGAASIRVTVTDIVLGFPEYAAQQEDGSLQGGLVNFWNCVFDGAGYQPEYHVLPARRAKHVLQGDETDFFIPKLKLDQIDTPQVDDARLTLPIHNAHATLLTAAHHRSWLEGDRWLKRRVGVVGDSGLNKMLVDKGGHIAANVVHFDRLMKMLLSERVDVALVLTPWKGERIHQFQGVPLVGRTLSVMPVHGFLGQTRHQQDPQLLAKLNEHIPRCKPHVLVFKNSPML